ncbi:hypothetical protein Scep_014559 [Stephania cephalantha]|uniref:Uncharacterized protein n=1 Tax=Stephania cephalantha TaxID=152367 RepID=A0AAP0J1J7_9MAGN
MMFHCYECFSCNVGSEPNVFWYTSHKRSIARHYPSMDRITNEHKRFKDQLGLTFHFHCVYYLVYGRYSINKYILGVEGESGVLDRAIGMNCEIIRNVQIVVNVKILGDLKDNKKVIVKSDVIDGSEKTSITQLFILISKEFENEDYLKPISEPQIDQKVSKDDIDEIRKIILFSPSLTDLEIVEKCYGQVFCFGGGIKRKHLEESKFSCVKKLEARLFEKDEVICKLQKTIKSIVERLDDIEKKRRQPSSVAPSTSNVEPNLIAYKDGAMRRATPSLNMSPGIVKPRVQLFRFMLAGVNSNDTRIMWVVIVVLKAILRHEPHEALEEAEVGEGVKFTYPNIRNKNLWNTDERYD